MIILNIYCAIVTSILIFLAIMFCKSENVLKNQIKNIEGIHSYRLDCLHKNISPQVDFNDMEDDRETLWRLWDWGYKRILPKEKFEIIKPYIEKRAK